MPLAAEGEAVAGEYGIGPRPPANPDEAVGRFQEALRSSGMRRLPTVEAAFGKQLAAILLQFNAARRGVEDLAPAVEGSFRTHPGSEILTSFTGRAR